MPQNPNLMRQLAQAAAQGRNSDTQKKRSAQSQQRRPSSTTDSTVDAHAVAARLAQTAVQKDMLPPAQAQKPPNGALNRPTIATARRKGPKVIFAAAAKGVKSNNNQRKSAVKKSASPSNTDGKKTPSSAHAVRSIFNNPIAEAVRDILNKITDGFLNKVENVYLKSKGKLSVNVSLVLIKAFLFRISQDYQFQNNTILFAVVNKFFDNLLLNQDISKLLVAEMLHGQKFDDSSKLLTDDQKTVYNQWDDNSFKKSFQEAFGDKICQQLGLTMIKLTEMNDLSSSSEFSGFNF